MGKKKKRPGSKRVFVEGIDSYCDEYEYWKKTTIIKRLVGIFEVAEEQFRRNLEDLLASVGLSAYSVVRYTSEYENKPGGDEPISGTGCAVAVQNVYGKIVPVVFVQKDVKSVGEESEEEHPQFSDSVRLLVLLHELGHADDISKGINYDHRELTVDFAEAEAYAHAFVCKQAQRNSYPVLLSLYLENVERMAKSEHDAERVGAEHFLQNGKAEELQRWIAERRSQAGLRKFLEKSRRGD